MKGYVVTLFDLPESVQVAERCIESAKQFNINVSKFHAVHKDIALQELEKEGLRIASEADEKKMLPGYKRGESDRGAVIGNFISQYRIWREILEENEPGIVLEHDAVFVDFVPDLKDKGDIINIGKPSYGSFKTKDIPGVYSMFSKPGGYIPGAHAYYVTPKGASDLIYKAQSFGAAPCDLFLNKKMFPDIKEIWPQVVEAQDSFTTIQLKVGCAAKHNFKANRKTYKILSEE